MTSRDDVIEPTVDDIERVKRAIEIETQGLGYGPEDEIYAAAARAAILAMDRRASQPAPAVAVPEGLRELQAWVMAERIALVPLTPDFLPKYSTLKAVGAKIRAMLAAAPTPPAAEAPEDTAEHFIQAAIDSAPEPLRRLGEWLSDVLDEDHWLTAEQLIVGASVAVARAAEAPGQEPVAAFGRGKLVVDFGTVGGVPAVFVAPAKQPGEVGASAKRENQPLDRMIEGEFFMTFPTEEQAKRVADVLMNRRPAPPASAEAEARAFARGIEAAAQLTAAPISGGTFEKFIVNGIVIRDSAGHELFMPVEAVDALLRSRAAAIRSLASPAPKGEGQ